MKHAIRLLVKSKSILLVNKIIFTCSVRFVMKFLILIDIGLNIDRFQSRCPKRHIILSTVDRPVCNLLTSGEVKVSHSVLLFLQIYFRYYYVLKTEQQLTCLMPVCSVNLVSVPFHYPLNKTAIFFMPKAIF